MLPKNSLLRENRLMMQIHHQSINKLLNFFFELLNNSLLLMHEVFYFLMDLNLDKDLCAYARIKVLIIFLFMNHLCFHVKNLYIAILSFLYITILPILCIDILYDLI